MYMYTGNQPLFPKYTLSYSHHQDCIITHDHSVIHSPKTKQCSKEFPKTLIIGHPHLHAYISIAHCQYHILHSSTHQFAPSEVTTNLFFLVVVPQILMHSC